MAVLAGGLRRLRVDDRWLSWRRSDTDAPPEFLRISDDPGILDFAFSDPEYSDAWVTPLLARRSYAEDLSRMRSGPDHTSDDRIVCHDQLFDLGREIWKSLMRLLEVNLEVVDPNVACPERAAEAHIGCEDLICYFNVPLVPQLGVEAPDQLLIEASRHGGDRAIEQSAASATADLTVLPSDRRP
jgi:hypothetical protein